MYPIYNYPLRWYPLKWLPNSRAKGKTVNIKQGGKEKIYIRKKEKEKDGEKDGASKKKKALYMLIY